MQKKEKQKFGSLLFLIFVLKKFFKPFIPKIKMQLFYIELEILEKDKIFNQLFLN